MQSSLIELFPHTKTRLTSFQGEAAQFNKGMFFWRTAQVFSLEPEDEEKVQLALIHDWIIMMWTDECQDLKS